MSYVLRFCEYDGYKARESARGSALGMFWNVFYFERPILTKEYDSNSIIEQNGESLRKVFKNKCVRNVDS